MKSYVVVFFGALAAALLTTPGVARLARAMRIVDRPGTRKVHTAAVPRIGGLAVVVSALAAAVPVIYLNHAIRTGFALELAHMLPLLATSAFIFVVGFVDDRIHIAARTKLLAQVAAALVACAAGIRIDFVAVAGWGAIHFGWWSWPITVVWIVGITNAVNLIDGLDGLAAGISAITCGAIAVFSIHTGQVVMATLMLGMLGALAGFLFYNFNPARIFLGDCGSMFLGFFLATASVVCATKSATLVGLALPALALGLPIFDTLFSMIRRALERRSMFAPDRNHLHHRLIGMGLKHRHAVILMYVVTLLAAGLGMFMMVTRDLATVAVFAGAMVPVLVIFRVVGAVRLREAFSAFQRNRAITREAKQQRQGFEHLQLRLREAEDLRQWWRAFRRAAREMDFARMVIELTDAEGAVHRLSWRLPERNGSAGRAIHVTVPLPHDRSGETLQAHVSVRINGSLESASRRLGLFGRLLDEHRLADLLRSRPVEAEGLDAAPLEPARLPGQYVAEAMLPSQPNK